MGVDTRSGAWLWHRTVFVRRTLLRIHRWTGLVAGVYLLLIGITGAVLVFRQELQAAAYPQFFRVDATSPVDPLVVLREIETAYPGYRVNGIDWPTYRRGTFLAYVSRGSDFRTVFADAASGRIVGELPFDWIRWLQEVHANLLGGSAGVRLNGAGAALLLLLVVSGLVVRWRGARRLLHVRVGTWLSPVLVLWAVTGVYFAFPQPFRNLVNAASPLTVVRAPQSDPLAAPAVVTPDALLARARDAWPEARVARFVWPYGERGTYVAVLARAVHGDIDTTDEVSLYFDQYSGALLLERDHGRRSAGDTLMSWIGPLHMGSFGGLTGKIVWAIFALAPPVLFLTGAVLWWNRAT